MTPRTEHSLPEEPSQPLQQLQLRLVSTQITQKMQLKVGRGRRRGGGGTGETKKGLLLGMEAALTNEPTAKLSPGGTLHKCTAPPPALALACLSFMGERDAEQGTLLFTHQKRMLLEAIAGPWVCMPAALQLTSLSTFLQHLRKNW